MSISPHGPFPSTVEARHSLYDRGYRTRPVRIPEIEVWTHLTKKDQRIITGSERTGWSDEAYPSWLD